MKPGDSKKLKLAKSQKTKEATSEGVDITNSESEEVDPLSKQTQDEETGAAAQTKNNLSPVVKLKRVHPTSGGVDTPQQGHHYITDEETRPLSCSGKLKTPLQQMAPKLHLAKHLTLKVQA